MATETTPDERSEIDMRWEMANYGRPSRRGEGIMLTTTKLHDRVARALEDIAASLVDDGVWDEEMQGDYDPLSAEDGLDHLIGETWDEIERRFKAWAARAPERRARIRAGWAAKAAEKAGTPAGE